MARDLEEFIEETAAHVCCFDDIRVSPEGESVAGGDFHRTWPEMRSALERYCKYLPFWAQWMALTLIAIGDRATA